MSPPKDPKPYSLNLIDIKDRLLHQIELLLKGPLLLQKLVSYPLNLRSSFGFSIRP